MAIVINGSGTVTGISVGGLPDGIVDAGTLATNSVDSAELIDGSIDNSHIDAMAASKLTGALPAISGASLTGLTSAQMPTGSVLQFAADADGTQIAANGTSWVDTNLSITFTPTSATSIIVAQTICLLNVAGAAVQHGQAGVQILKDGTTWGQEMRQMCGYGGTEALFVGPVNNWASGAQGNTNALVYKVQFKLVQSLGSVTYNPYTGHSMLFIWEVAA